jgi:hypothetical protein
MWHDMVWFKMILNGVAPKSHESKAHVKNNDFPVVGQFGGASVLASRERLEAWPNPAREDARPTKKSSN